MDIVISFPFDNDFHWVPVFRFKFQVYQLNFRINIFFKIEKTIGQMVKIDEHRSNMFCT